MTRSVLAFFVLMALGLTMAPALARDEKAERDKVLDAPPVGVVATTATLAEVLKQHDAAIGRHPGLQESRHEEWQRTDFGFAGTETLDRRGLDYRSRIVRGPFVEEFGQLDGHRWHRVANGSVYPMTTEDYDSFAMFRVVEDAADPKNDAKLLGEVAAPKPSYLVEVRRAAAKHPEWIFFDKASGLVNRTESTVGRRRFAADYDDYRNTNGYTEAWHVHDNVAELGIDNDYRRISLKIGETIATGLFGMPAGAFAPGGFDKPGLLAGKITNETVVVRLTVRGRGLDFELSAGAPVSVIDRDTAKELDLPTFGQTTRTKDGKDFGYDTEIAEANVGQSVLHHLALRVVHFNYNAGYGTKIVGLLGTDFLKSGVFKVDFVNGRTDVVAPSDLNDTLLKGTYRVPLTIDDGLPLTSGTIGGHTVDNVVVDFQWPVSFIMAPFTDLHPDATPNARGTRRKATVPFADSANYGRELEIWSSEADLHFSSAHFVKLKVIATNDSSPYSHDVDAIVGFDVLWYFDVYLDFANDRMFLKPNKNFASHFLVKPLK